MRRAGRSSAIFLVALAVSGCGDSIGRRVQAGATPEFTPVAVGKGIVIVTPQPTPEPTPVKKPAAPLFVLQLNDQNGLHPEGIPIRLSGAQNRTVLSDEAGEVKVYKPGIYEAEARVGCHDGVFISKGGGVSFGAAQGDSSRGTLALTWSHQVAPAAPVYADHDRDWPVGEKVTVTFTVSDRCSDERVPRGEYPSYAFVVPSNLKLASAPTLRADDQGNGRVVLMCTRAGKVGLVAEDRANPSDKVDLFAYSVGYTATPRCVD